MVGGKKERKGFLKKKKKIENIAITLKFNLVGNLMGDIDHYFCGKDV